VGCIEGTASTHAVAIDPSRILVSVTNGKQATVLRFDR
jgi:hypothetical protein